MPKYTAESYARRNIQPALKKQGYALSVDDITKALFQEGDFRFEPAENKIYAPHMPESIVRNGMARKLQRKPASREQIHQRLVHHYAQKVFPRLKGTAALPLRDYATRREAKRQQLSLALQNDNPEEAAKGLDMYLAFLEENKEFFAFPGAEEGKEQRRHYSSSWIGNKASFASLRGHSKGVLHALDSLEWLLSEAGGKTGTAFAETIPYLYTIIGRESVDKYLVAVIPLLHAYKSLPKKASPRRKNAVMKKLTDYLRLQGEEAEKQFLLLVKEEHHYHLLVESANRAERRERIQALEKRVRDAESERDGLRRELSEARSELERTHTERIEHKREEIFPHPAPEVHKETATAHGEADKRSNKLFPYAIGAGAILVSAALVYGLKTLPERLSHRQAGKSAVADVSRTQKITHDFMGSEIKKEDISAYAPDAGVNEDEGTIIGPEGAMRVPLR